MKEPHFEGNEIPLTVLKAGEAGTIVSIIVGSQGRGYGYGFKKRLMDLGLTPGTRVIVVKSAFLRGPLEICVRTSRLAIGRGIASCIFVKKDET